MFKIYLMKYILKIRDINEYYSNRLVTDKDINYFRSYSKYSQDDKAYLLNICSLSIRMLLDKYLNKYPANILEDCMDNIERLKRGEKVIFNIEDDLAANIKTLCNLYREINSIIYLGDD